MEFFRFPHTPHLVWLGEGQPRGDKLLSPDEAANLLKGSVLVEEKVDGANIGLSVDPKGRLRAQNRGAFLSREASHPQFKPLFRWLDQRRGALEAALSPGLILFGEWCYAVHSVRYTRLPDWFLAFDVYDRVQRAFWSAACRDAFVRRLGVGPVPQVSQGHYDLAGVARLLGPSKLTDGHAEGLYIRRDEGDRLVGRAKVVRPEFMQGIDNHWSARQIRTNGLVSGATW